MPFKSKEEARAYNRERMRKARQGNTFVQPSKAKPEARVTQPVQPDVQPSPKPRVRLHCDNKVRDLYTGQVIE